MLTETQLRTATGDDLRTLRSRIFEELRRRDQEGVPGEETSSPPGGRSGREVIDQKGGNGRWLKLERVKCGKTRCKRCADGVGHGPYYYLYLTNPKTGRYTSKYVGKPANVTEEMRQEFGIEVAEPEVEG
jgi:hypothetical protein